MYSLVSASVLAIDLSRHPTGAAVADVVDRVLALTESELASLDACSHRGAPKAVRDRVLAACADAPRIGGVLGLVATTLEGTPSEAVSRTIVEALSETMVGGLVDLLEMLRREALQGAPSEAVQVALDAVTAAWAGRTAEFADLAQLRAPWAQSLSAVPVSLPETAYGEALRTLLDEVSRRTPGQWQRVADAHRAQSGRLMWSTRMHEACRAAYDAGRLRDVARAQLAAARALRLSGASTGADAHAIAMVVTAAVQAVCTGDLIETRALREAWLAAS